MLSKPNVNELMGKIDNRYEMAVAVAKRARDIADKRVKEGSKDIKDPVDVAAKEIYEGKVLVIKAKHEELEEVEEIGKEEVKAEEVNPTVSEEESKSEEVENVVEEIAKDEKPKAKKTRSTKSKEAK